MKVITLEDLQELGRLLKGVKGTEWRPMTEQEIENFGIIPKGATKYKTLKSGQTACKKRGEIAYEAGSNPDKGLFWTFVK